MLRFYASITKKISFNIRFYIVHWYTSFRDLWHASGPAIRNQPRKTKYDSRSTNTSLYCVNACIVPSFTALYPAKVHFGFRPVNQTRARFARQFARSCPVSCGGVACHTTPNATLSISQGGPRVPRAFARNPRVPPCMLARARLLARSASSSLLWHPSMRFGAFPAFFFLVPCGIVADLGSARVHAADVA